MANKRATIYERIKIQGRWTDCPAVLPNLSLFSLRASATRTASMERQRQRHAQSGYFVPLAGGLSLISSAQRCFCYFQQLTRSVSFWNEPESE